MIKKIELLAPAGSLETLKAVCAAGADAVYLGGAQFGARAYAKNFTQDELLYAIDYVHLHEKKLHLTVNTLLKDRELEEQLYDYLLPYYEQGLDAVIVQDTGVFSFIKKHFPGMELHASTQMTITGADGVKFWKEAGADRVVLARELSLDEIRHIHETVDVELECFVHGALCYCYSGQCLFSSMLGGRSGNRGRCAQPCRLPYGVLEAGSMRTKGEQYPLSPKDLCGIDLLDQIVQAGVSSLKIEGRMKQTQYAAGVTAIYRKYLDLLENMDLDSKDFDVHAKDRGIFAVAENDRNTLMELGNRSGFTAGYLRGEKGRHMISLDSPKHTSGQSEETRVIEERKRPVTGSCICTPGQHISLTVSDITSGRSVTVYGGEVQTAKNAPALPEDIKKVLRQTGDTDFQFLSLQVELGDHCFIPKQFLKAVRRDALEKLKQDLLCVHRRQGLTRIQEDLFADQSFSNAKEPAKDHLLVVCDTLEQLTVCLKKDYIHFVALQLQSFLPGQLCDVVAETANLCAHAGKKLLLAMPSAFRSKTADAYEKIWKCMGMMHEEGKVDGFLAKNYDSLGFLRRMGVSEACVWLDSPLYTFSERAALFFRGQGYRKLTLPLELNGKELRRLSQEDRILLIYGHAPFMVTNQCVNKTISGCDHTEKNLELVDRYGKRLPVKNYCGVCCNMIYNAVPTLLFSDRTWSEVQKIQPQMFRMDFTVECEARMKEVLLLYEQRVLGRQISEVPFFGESTRGHFGRGIE